MQRKPPLPLALEEEEGINPVFSAPVGALPICAASTSSAILL